MYKSHVNQKICEKLKEELILKLLNSGAGDYERK